MKHAKEEHHHAITILILGISVFGLVYLGNVVGGLNMTLDNLLGQPRSSPTLDDMLHNQGLKFNCTEFEIHSVMNPEFQNKCCPTFHTINGVLITVCYEIEMFRDATVNAQYQDQTINITACNKVPMMINQTGKCLRGEIVAL